jgi:hypothetical protein
MMRTLSQMQRAYSEKKTIPDQKKFSERYCSQQADGAETEEGRGQKEIGRRSSNNGYATNNSISLVRTLIWTSWTSFTRSGRLGVEVLFAKGYPAQRSTLILAIVIILVIVITRALL